VRACECCGRAVYDARAVALVVDGRMVASAFFCRRCVDEPLQKMVAAIDVAKNERTAA
jgi:hypothetical protein